MNDSIEKNATGETKIAANDPRRPPGSVFVEGYLTPAQRRARKAWLADNMARERQLTQVTRDALTGYGDGGTARRGDGLLVDASPFRRSVWAAEGEDVE